MVPRLLVPFVWLLSGHISATTLRGLETAVELWASLTQSLQTEWLQYSGLYGELLLEEVGKGGRGGCKRGLAKRYRMHWTLQTGGVIWPSPKV